VIKPRRKKWMRHAAAWENEKSLHTFSRKKKAIIRSLGKHRRRLENNIKMDIKVKR
jgi:hypothetical protein